MCIYIKLKHNCLNGVIIPFYLFVYFYNFISYVYVVLCRAFFLGRTQVTSVAGAKIIINS